MRNSLRALLVIGLAGLQLLAVLAVVFSSYVTSERALLDHARDLLSDVGGNTIEHSKSFLGPARGAAELSARLAQNHVIASDDPQLLEQLLFQQLQLSPQFAGVFHGSEDGDFVYVMRSGGPGPFRSKIIQNDGDAREVELIWRNDDFEVVERRFDPEDTYDPRARPWYKDARAGLATIWTNPYIFFSSQQPGITLASPVMSGPGTVSGIVGVDIEISEISDFLSRLRIGESGQAIIMHENGDVIAHPDKEMIKTRDDEGKLRFSNIEDFADPIARTAFAGMMRAGNISVSKETLSQFSYDGETYVSVVMPPVSDRLPWTIAAYAPESDFTAVIEDNRRNNIWIAILVAAITGMSGLLIAEYIHRPVRAFAVRSALISQGEIDAAEPAPATYKELDRANTTLMQQIAARKETELEYGQTFALSSRGMAQILPSSGKIIRTNEKFRDITGYSEGELSKMSFSDLAHLDDRPFEHLDGEQGDGIEINQEMRCRCKDGRVIWVSVNAIMVHNQEGKAVHIVLTMDDITAAKSSEDQISQLSRDLSNLSRDNTMAQMAAGLAHELNQPLTAVAQNADTALLMVEQEPATNPEVAEILQEIEEQSLRAGEIIRALRGFIRRDEGVRSAFDLGELVTQTRYIVVAEAHASGAKITTDLDLISMVEANRIQVAQVLVNLLRNAIEAVGDNAEGERQVQVTARQRGPQAVVCVADNGPGVNPDINLFSQFETTKSGGMGLGLSICRTMVEANGGELWNEENPGGGARFCFTLNATVD